MSESAETYGDFVVSCAPIVRREVARLRRRGAPWVEQDDAQQEAFLILLENEESLASRAGSLATMIVRRRLLSRYVEREHTQARGGWAVALPLGMFMEDSGSDAEGGTATPRDTNSGFGAQYLDAISVQQPDVIDGVTLSELEAVEPLPRPSGKSRQRDYQAQYRWARRMQRFVATGEHDLTHCRYGHQRAEFGYRDKTGKLHCRGCDRSRA